MYNYFKARITYVTAQYIVIECHDIGYQVKVPNPYIYKEGDTLTLFTHLIVKEDAHDLYGFNTLIERDTFIRLINVKGLGPKGALAIMAGATTNEIFTAINTANAHFFTKFPGIGQKSSQQIILDLKGKIDFNENSTLPTPNTFCENVISALKALGYNANEIKKIIPKINQELPLALAVKEALKALNTK